jgi:hypothetical protein
MSKTRKVKLVTINPYLNNYGDDSDVFKEDVESSPSASSSKPIGEALPRDMQDALGNIADQHIHSNVSQEAYPMEFRGVSQLLENVRESIYVNESEVYILAAAEVLDELTDGAYSRRVAMHFAANSLRNAHLSKRWMTYIVKLLNEIVLDLKNTPSYFHEIPIYIESMKDFVDWKIESNTQSYLGSCEELDIAPDTDLIEYGISKKISNAHFHILNSIAQEVEG